MYSDHLIVEELTTDVTSQRGCPSDLDWVDAPKLSFDIPSAVGHKCPSVLLHSSDPRLSPYTPSNLFF
ncbi:hypothetical protein J6590_006546 [Homalodisca vitripennis]|nr:hypothetical protein J6590_006546 [Homalodisca vitripennis]